LGILRYVCALFKRKSIEVEVTEAQIKWSKMWAVWDKEGCESPYEELMEYVSEVSNGGHGQYFCNVENNGDVEKSVLALYSILPAILKENLKRSYRAYKKWEQLEFEDEADAIMQECDAVYWEIGK